MQRAHIVWPDAQQRSEVFSANKIFSEQSNRQRALQAGQVVMTMHMLNDTPPLPPASSLSRLSPLSSVPRPSRSLLALRAG